MRDALHRSGRAFAQYSHGFFTLFLRNASQKQFAIEVIHFVLQDAAFIFVAFNLDGFAVSIKTFDYYMFTSSYWKKQTRHRQTSFVELPFTIARDCLAV